MKRLLKGRKGFTLVEILIVVVMLAILFAIAVPIYSNYVASARSTEAQESISAIWAGAKIYHAEEGEWPDVVSQMRKLEFDKVTENRWNFTIVSTSRGITSITATSTDQMRGGRNKRVSLNVETGQWKGYGFDTY